MKVEIWSDVVCPWCYIGKRRFEEALRRFEHREEVEVTWRAFELDPRAPAERSGRYDELLAKKYGTTPTRAQEMIDHMTRAAAVEGVEMDFEKVRPGNTFTAHRLLHLASRHGLQDALKERLMRAYFTDGESVGDPKVLERLALETGLEAADVRHVLESSEFADEVRVEEAEAGALGITGVPFFVVNRKYGVSGAQSPELLLAVLQRAWADERPLTLVGTSGQGADCADGSCAV